MNQSGNKQARRRTGSLITSFFWGLMGLLMVLGAAGGIAEANDPAFLVKDICPGGCDSEPASLANLNGSLFFSAYDGVVGYELWMSDGTEVGTRLLKDLWQSGGSNPRNLTDVNGTLFFTAGDGSVWIRWGSSPFGAWGGTSYSYTVGIRYLWKTDGTPEGTVPVKLLGVAPDQFTNVNGTLFFTVDAMFSGRELWRSDGTPQGTSILRDIYPGTHADINSPSLTQPRFIPNGSSPKGLTSIQGTLFFSADDGVHGRELWMSDGTTAGTVLVKDINPGNAGSSPSSLTELNGRLFFAADDGVHGRQLWISDGTEAGTVLFKDINVWRESDYTNVNGTLFLEAYSEGFGYELWMSDGTREGTVLVKDICPGDCSASPDELTNVNGTLFFTAHDGAHGTELWMSDGTAEGTSLVRDINPGGRAELRELTDVDGVVFFMAEDGTHGRSLWRSDGTPEGTMLVKSIEGKRNYYYHYLTNVNGTLFFVIDDGVHGRELWAIGGDTPPATPVNRTGLTRMNEPGSTSREAFWSIP